MKTCRNCGVLFDTSYCKACAKVRGAKQYRENKEKIRLWGIAYREATKQERKAAAAKYIEANRAKLNEAHAKWRHENPTKAKASRQKWKKANPEYVRIDKENRRAKLRGINGKLSAGLTEKLFKLQKGKCACCCEPLGCDYHRDHIIPLALGGLNEDRNIQLLRRECNFKKGAKHPIEFMQSRGLLL